MNRIESRRELRATAILPLVLMMSMTAPARASEAGVLDHSAWDSIVKEYVNAEALVDYARLKQHGIEKLDGYIAQIERRWPDGLTRDGEKGAMINSHNS